jgi:predicted transcriptional regulator
MHMYIRILEQISGRYAPSRVISFDIAHIFKALQLIETRGHISRDLLCEELNLGEGSIKTLVKHLKMEDMIETSNAGTRMSDKGKRFFEELQSSIPRECTIPKCSIALGKFNYAILLKQLSFAVKSGIEQRDAAIRMGAIGATTLLFRNERFMMPSTHYFSLKKELHIHKLLIEKLNPEVDDLIIIGSDDKNMKTAELAAKSAALLTVRNHEKHR